MKNRFLANIDRDKVFKIAAAAVLIGLASTFVMSVRTCYVSSKKAWAEYYKEEIEQRRYIEQFYREWDEAHSRGD
jgi:hypothetical protein